jgi:hypothetical protein
MKFEKRSLYWIGLVLPLFTANAAWATIIGPGDVATNTQDTGFNLLIVDLNAPLTMTAGSHNATQFNYEFGSSAAGSITPLLLTGNGVDNFTPIAVGATIAYSGATSFISATFGGSDAFTLPSSDTVYAGLFWNSTTVTMPVGFLNGTGSSFIRYVGANSPTVGAPINGGFQGTFSRTYDFSISVDAAPVPEPSIITLFGIGLAGLVSLRSPRSAGIRPSVAGVRPA